MRALTALVFGLLVIVGGHPSHAWQVEASGKAVAGRTSNYILGPGDEVSIWALGVEEFPKTPLRITPGGEIDLPLIGRIRVVGLTTNQLRDLLTEKLKVTVRDPKVTVNIFAFRSQPVSVIGAVKNPGVHQIEDRKSLIEVLSLAGGLREDASRRVKITRKLEHGPIPVTGAAVDPSGKFSLAEIDLEGLIKGQKPEMNIVIQPDDVVSVPSAQLVYVMGEVTKPGGFMLKEGERLTVLQALALAAGLTRFASPKKARILRPTPAGGPRTEVALNLKKMLDGKARDIDMEADDVLFVPNDATKSTTMKAIDTAISLGTGMLIWRR